MASGMLITTVTTANTPADAPLTSCSIEFRIVSRVWVLVMMTETPPASRTTRAGPIMSEAPAAMSRTTSFSFMRATTPTRMLAMMKSIASWGNHQLSSNQNGSTVVAWET